MNLSTFLREQGIKYQSHLLKQNKLSTTVHFQRNMQLYKSIPKQYLPPSGLDVPTNDNESLLVEFTRAYEEIFFQHLDKVIIHNTISLELEESHLRNITTIVKKHLSHAGVPAELTTELLRVLFSKNKLSYHSIEPALQRILPNTTAADFSDLGLPPPPPPSSPPPTPPQTQNPSITHSTSKLKRKRCQGQKAVKKAKTIEAVHSPAANNSDPSFLSQRPHNKHWT